jgi:hypothetical protein
VAVALLLLCLSQAAGDPRIDTLECLLGEAHRPGLFAPLRVTLSSAAGFSGDVTARSSFGYAYAREVKIAAGGTGVVFLPAIDPVEVVAGKSVAPVRLSPLTEEQALVAVDARLDYARDLVSGDRAAFRALPAADLRALLSAGMMEAFDLVLLKDREDLPLAAYASVGTWKIAPSRAEADAAIAEVRTRRLAITATDPPWKRLWALAPADRWVPSKRTHAPIFATVYGFAAFLALLLVGPRRARVAAPAVVGVAALGVVAFLVLFPRGRLWGVVHSCEVVVEPGRSAEWRAWFVGSGTAVETDVQFPCLVKPVLEERDAGEYAFVIRAGDAGCRVERLRFEAGRAACFAGVVERATKAAAAPSLSVPIYRAYVLRANRNRSLGDLPAGAVLPGEVAEDGPAPREPDFGALGSRFATDDCAFGWLDTAERPADDLHSDDLADARLRPRFILFRLR